MHERYGCAPEAEPRILHLGSRRIMLNHGDGLLGYDWVYNTFRTMVRTRLGIVLAKSLHPEILYGFSEWLSGTSRAPPGMRPTRSRPGPGLAPGEPFPRLDLLVMGHVHHAFTAEHEGKSLTALAGWFDTLGYAIWQDGQFQLRDFDRDPLPQF